ncbi:unnamed protein product [Heterobilharzia americana]|nr:unnamed protein product [Heterobilharzia americana]
MYITTESSCVATQPVGNDDDAMLNTIETLSHQVKELHEKLTDSEDTKKHLTEQINNLKESLSLSKLQVNTSPSNTDLNDTAYNSEIISLKTDLSNLQILNSELTIQLNQAKSNIEQFNSTQIEQLKQIDELKIEINSFNDIKQQNNNLKTLLNQMKQLKIDLFNKFNEKSLQLLFPDNNNSLNSHDFENIHDVQCFTELLVNALKVTYEGQICHYEKVKYLVSQLNELTDNLNENQSIQRSLEYELTSSQSSEQDQHLLVDKLIVQIKDLQNDYKQRLSNVEDNLQNEMKKYSDLQLKYTQIDKELNVVQNQLDIMHKLKSELELKVLQHLEIQTNLENKLSDLETLHEKDQQSIEHLTNNQVDNHNNHNTLNHSLIKLKEDLQKSNDQYTQLLNDYKSVTEKLMNTEKQLNIEQDKFTAKSNELLTVNEELKCLKQSFINLQDNHQFELHCQLNEQSVKYESEINSLRNDIEQIKKSSDETTNSKIEYLTNENKFLSDEIQSLQQILNSTENQLEDLKIQLKTEMNIEQEKLKIELIKANDFIEKLKSQLNSSIQENISLNKVFNNNSEGYQQDIHELVMLSNQICELFVEQSEQMNIKLNPIWNILETSEHRLNIINENIDIILKTTNNRYQVYSSTIDQLQSELFNVNNQLITCNNEINNLQINIIKKNDEINEVHLKLDQYHSLNRICQTFVSNTHSQLYHSVIQLCQSRIACILFEIKEYLSVDNNNNNSNNNNNNNGGDDISHEYNQVRFEAQHLADSFNSIEKMLISQMDNFNKLSTDNNDNFELFSTWINSELNNQLTTTQLQTSQLNDQLIKSQNDYQTLKETIKIRNENFSTIESALLKANQSVDELKQNEIILKDKYTTQLILYEQSQEVVCNLQNQLKLAIEKSDYLSKELLEKESLINNTLEESDKAVSCLRSQCNDLQNEMKKLQLEHSDILQDCRQKHEEELNKLIKKHEDDRSQCIAQLKIEHQNALLTAVTAKEKQLKQQNIELKNRLKQVLQELETSKKSSNTPSRREVELQGSLSEVEDKLKHLQSEYQNQCQLISQLQLKVNELELQNTEMKENSNKNSVDNNNFLSDSVSEIHENYQLQIELLKAEHVSHIQEMTKEFERKLLTNERELNTEHKAEIDQTSTKLKCMEELHSAKLSQLEGTILVQERQNIELKSCINELQSELRRTKDEVNIIEAKYQSKMNSTFSTSSIISRHDNFTDEEANSCANSVHNGKNQLDTSSRINNSRSSIDAYDDWIEKLRQDILHSDSIDTLHPALRQNRYPTSVPIRDYEALELHNTDLQNQLQQLSADFEALRSKCLGTCGKEFTEHTNSLSKSLHIHTNDSMLQSSHSSILLNSMQKDYHHHHQYNAAFSPSENRLHELVEYEYLKNVLFEYMQGRETQTLSKVLCTLMRFNADQTRKVLSYEDQKSKEMKINPMINYYSV